MRTARWIFWIAGIWGLVILVPQYFLLGQIDAQTPPAVTHVEYFYGFIGIAIVFQFLFLRIGSDPTRYRPLMPLAMLEKLAFALPAFVLYSRHQTGTNICAAGAIDFILMLLFIVAWRVSDPSRLPGASQ